MGVPSASFDCDQRDFGHTSNDFNAIELTTKLLKILTFSPESAINLRIGTHGFRLLNAL